MDEFSDDGFDDLPDNALQELEQNALLQFTQRAPDAAAAAATTDGGVDFHANDGANKAEFADLDDDADYDAAVVTDERDRPVVDPAVFATPRRAAATTAQAPPHAWLGHESSVGGGVGRGLGGLGSRPDASALGYNLAANRRTGGGGATTAVSHQGGFARPAPPVPKQQRQQQQHFPDRTGPPSSSNVNHVGGGWNPNMLAALQARVRALEQDLNASRGEVSIVRAKLNRSAQEHAAEVGRIKAGAAEAATRTERQVEAARAAERIASTELQFVNRALKEEMDRTKRRNTDRETGGGANGSSMGGGLGPNPFVTPGPMTPKKAARARAMTDGFEDLDLAPSPSKMRACGVGAAISNVGQAGSAERTPTKAGSKRKRPANFDSSPVVALEVHDITDGPPPTDDEVPVKPATEPAVAEAVAEVRNTNMLAPKWMGCCGLTLSTEEHRKRVTSGIMAAQLPSGSMVFDVLAGFALPSNPSRNLGTMILQNLSLMGDANNNLQLHIDFFNFVAELVKQCVTEKYFAPINNLLQLLKIGWYPHIAQYVFASFVPMAQAAVAIVARARFDSEYGYLRDSPEVKRHQELIDTKTIMNMLADVEQWCFLPVGPKLLDEDLNPVATVGIWERMETSFVLIMLSDKQPMAEFMAMLRVLRRAAQETSLGSSTHRDAEEKAGAIIDKVSMYLVQMPKFVHYKDWFLRQKLTMQVLATLQSFTRSTFGLVQLAKNRSLAPRLVLALNSALSDLNQGNLPSKHIYIRPHQPESPDTLEKVRRDFEELKTRSERTERDRDSEANDVAMADAAGASRSDADTTLIDLTAPSQTGRRRKSTRHQEARAATPPEQSLVAPKVWTKTQEDAWRIDGWKVCRSPPPPPGPQPKFGGEDENLLLSMYKHATGTEPVYSIVSQAVHLLWQLVKSDETKDILCLEEKLHRFGMAWTRYHITLARIHFSPERGPVEAKIDHVAQEKAQDLLAMNLTPEKAETLTRFFGSSQEGYE